jgi:tRNA threonylcarbamoyladenosine biosynthesis protein TsaE
MKEVTHLVSKHELKNIAKKALVEISRNSHRSKAAILVLSGNLGAGKTTFVQEFAKLLNIKDRVLSPTFVFIHEHAIGLKNSYFEKLIHVDAYRIADAQTLKAIRLSEYFKDPKNLVVIEWGNKIAKWIPRADLEITFEHYSPKLRRISMQNK